MKCGKSNNCTLFQSGQNDWHCPLFPLSNRPLQSEKDRSGGPHEWDRSYQTYRCPEGCKLRATRDLQCRADGWCFLRKCWQKGCKHRNHFLLRFPKRASNHLQTHPKGCWLNVSQAMPSNLDQCLHGPLHTSPGLAPLSSCSMRERISQRWVLSRDLFG